MVGDVRPTLQMLRAMPFTTRAINESMRLYPQPPVLIRFHASLSIITPHASLPQIELVTGYLHCAFRTTARTLLMSTLMVSLVLGSKVLIQGPD